MKKKIISITTATVLCAGAIGVAMYASAFDSKATPDAQPAANISQGSSVYETVPTEEPTEAGRKLAQAVNPEDASKDDIYYMMLNTIDYFDKASGAFYYPGGGDFNLNDISSVEFQTEMSATTTYSHEMEAYVGGDTIEEVIKNLSDSENIEEIIWDSDYYCDGDYEVTIDYMKGSYKSSTGNTISFDNIVEIPDEERVTVDEDGEPCYYCSNDPTNIRFSSMCLQPQEFTFSFLTNRDLWEIEGTEEVNGRLCYHITGQIDRLDVKTFEFFTDVKTGVLLKYVGYDDNGDISDYVYTDISFDDKAEEVQAFSNDLLEGLKEENLY